MDGKNLGPGKVKRIPEMVRQTLNREVWVDRHRDPRNGAVESDAVKGTPKRKRRVYSSSSILWISLPISSLLSWDLGIQVLPIHFIMTSTSRFVYRGRHRNNFVAHLSLGCRYIWSANWQFSSTSNFCFYSDYLILSLSGIPSSVCSIDHLIPIRLVFWGPSLLSCLL